MRDLFDLLGESDEPLTFFALHDADGPGTIIYQSLVRETRARKERNVKVIDLGLSPEEGQELGLPVERYEQRGKIACADKVSDRWREQFGVGTKSGRRIELNAMTSPLFFDWLDAKMAVHVGKVVPPAPVMAERVRAGVRANLRAPIVERALADAGVDRQVDDAERALADRMAAPS